MRNGEKIPETLLQTTVVGSYPPPGWLVDREVLLGRVLRTTAPKLWKVDASDRQEALDDATRLAVRDMETAGIDIVSDGEIRRESYGVRFVAALEGVDADNPGEVISRTGQSTFAPRIKGRLRRVDAVEVRDAAFLRSVTRQKTKITMPGPFTLMRQTKDEFYHDEEAAAMAFAEVINAELHEIKAAGIDVVQLDEPWMQSWPETAGKFGLQAINRALKGIEGTTVVHICFGYAQKVKDKASEYAFLPEFENCIATQISIEAAQPNLELSVLRDLPSKDIVLGVLNLGSDTVESAQTVADRIERAFDYVPPERIIPAPDCGMKYMPRALAFGKLNALAAGAALARSRLS